MVKNSTMITLLLCLVTMAELRAQTEIPHVNADRSPVNLFPADLSLVPSPRFPTCPGIGPEEAPYSWEWMAAFGLTYENSTVAFDLLRQSGDGYKHELVSNRLVLRPAIGLILPEARLQLLLSGGLVVQDGDGIGILGVPPVAAWSMSDIALQSRWTFHESSLFGAAAQVDLLSGYFAEEDALASNGDFSIRFRTIFQFDFELSNGLLLKVPFDFTFHAVAGESGILDRTQEASAGLGLGFDLEQPAGLDLNIGFAAQGRFYTAADSRAFSDEGAPYRGAYLSVGLSIGFPTNDDDMLWSATLDAGHSPSGPAHGSVSRAVGQITGGKTDTGPLGTPLARLDGVVRMRTCRHCQTAKMADRPSIRILPRIKRAPCLVDFQVAQRCDGWSVQALPTGGRKACAGKVNMPVSVTRVDGSGDAVKTSFDPNGRLIVGADLVDGPFDELLLTPEPPRGVSLTRERIELKSPCAVVREPLHSASDSLATSKSGCPAAFDQRALEQAARDWPAGLQRPLMVGLSPQTAHTPNLHGQCPDPRLNDKSMLGDRPGPFCHCASTCAFFKPGVFCEPLEVKAWGSSLLQGLGQLSPEVRSRIVIEIHGVASPEWLHRQPADAANSCLSELRAEYGASSLAGEAERLGITVQKVPEVDVASGAAKASRRVEIRIYVKPEMPGEPLRNN